MQVKVIRHACPCAFAEIHTHVVAFRGVSRLQRFFNMPCQQRHFFQCVIVKTAQGSNVRVRSDQNMASGVRVKIQEDEIEPSPIENKLFAVMRGVTPGHLAKRTPVFWRPFGYITKAPRAPEIVHKFKIQFFGSGASLKTGEGRPYSMRIAHAPARQERAGLQRAGQRPLEPGLRPC